VGDTLVVGSEKLEGAYVFSRYSPGTWGFIQFLDALDGKEDDYFSQNIAFDGDTMLIGASGVAVNAAVNVGAAYVFILKEGLWVEKQKLMATDGKEDDDFGYNVAIRDDMLVVGAIGDRDRGRHAGAAYIFYLQNDKWIQTDKLTALDGAKYDNFGLSVAMSPGLIAVGANGQDEGKENAGAVYVYTLNTLGKWTQVQKLQASDMRADAYFGGILAASDDGTLVVTAPADNNSSGSAYVFSCTAAGVCTETDVLRAADGRRNDYFGGSVSISYNTIVVGAPGDKKEDANYYDKSTGSIYTFTRELEGGWVETSKIDGADVAQDDAKFGEQVAISTHTVAVVGRRGLAHVKEVCDS